MKKILVLMFLVLVFVSCQKKEEANVGSTPNTAATKFERMNSAKLKEVLASNKGNVVLINFFATWCPPCRQEVPELIQLKNSYAGKNVVFIGLNVDETGEETLKPFAEKVGFNYPVYLADPELSKEYQVDAIPNSFLFSKDGKLIQNLKGYVDPGSLKGMIDALL